MKVVSLKGSKKGWNEGRTIGSHGHSAMPEKGKDENDFPGDSSRDLFIP